MLPWMLLEVMLKLVRVVRTVRAALTLKLLTASGMFSNVLAEALIVMCSHRTITTAVSCDVVIIIALGGRPPVRRRLRVVGILGVVKVDNFVSGTATGSSVTVHVCHALTAELFSAGTQ